MCEWKRKWQENPHRNSWYTQLQCLRSSCLQCEPRLCHLITPRAHIQSIVHKLVEHKRYPLQWRKKEKKFTCAGTILFNVHPIEWREASLFSAFILDDCHCCRGSQLFLLQWEQFNKKKTPTRFHSYCVRILTQLCTSLPLCVCVCDLFWLLAIFFWHKRHFNKTNVPGGESNIHIHMSCAKLCSTRKWKEKILFEYKTRQTHKCSHCFVRIVRLCTGSSFVFDVDVEEIIAGFMQRLCSTNSRTP